jgi:hypothetical protein
VWDSFYVGVATGALERTVDRCAKSTLTNVKADDSPVNLFGKLRIVMACRAIAVAETFTLSMYLNGA